MKVAAIQFTSKLDPETNLEKIRKLLVQAKQQKVDAVFLPECFYSMGDGQTATPFTLTAGSRAYHTIRNLAKASGLYLVGGSAATAEKSRILNRTYSFDPDGRKLPHYDKIHLFRLKAAGAKSKKLVDERDIYTPGQKPQMITIGHWKIGLSVCFDLRFPELYRYYSSKGANILSVASAFTVPTGQAHWHALLRARAIENQAYVIAAAQWGRHHRQVSTFGHSLIIDPWGEVLADAKKGEKLITADLDLHLVQQVRSRLNSLPET